MSEDGVSFRIGNRMVEMSIRDRDAFLSRANELTDARLADVCRRVEDAGTSRKIEIYDPEELDALHGFLQDWVRREKKSPSGIRKLNREVRDELDWLLGPE
jgi:hypothetical protein